MRSTVLSVSIALETIVKNIAKDENIGNMQYVYDATGKKLSKQSNIDNSLSGPITEYAGGYIYEKSGGYSHNGQFWQGAEVGHGLKNMAIISHLAQMI